MYLTIRVCLPATLVLATVLAWAAPAYAAGKARLAPVLMGHRARAAQRIELYSPRVRRSTVMYLRLRLLELREEGLDRARAVIERRMSIDDLLARPAGKSVTGPQGAQP